MSVFRPESRYAPPEPPVDPERVVAPGMFWGDVNWPGGFDGNTSESTIQMLFVWDPRVQDWVTVSHAIFHFGIDGTASATGRSNFRRPGMEGDGASNAVCPGNGYVYAAFTSYNSGTLNADHFLDVYQNDNANLVSRRIARVPYPPVAGYAGFQPQAYWKFQPPLLYNALDGWQFILANPSFTGTSCNYPWLDVYWHWRYVDPRSPAPRNSPAV